MAKVTMAQLTEREAIRLRTQRKRIEAELIRIDRAVRPMRPFPGTPPIETGRKAFTIEGQEGTIGEVCTDQAGNLLVWFVFAKPREAPGRWAPAEVIRYAPWTKEEREAYSQWRQNEGARVQAETRRACDLERERDSLARDFAGR